MRLVAFLLLAVVLGIANPTVRGQIEPHAETVLEPLYRWRTDKRLAEITRALEAEAASGRAIPTTTAELAVTLTRLTAFGSGSEDAWGTPFHMVRSGFTARVVSAGPDRILGTADDLRGPALGVPPR
jgi:hypothetical protein